MQGVGGSMFRDTRRADGFLYCFLDYRFIDVVAALDAGGAVKILTARRKHELPAALRIRVRIPAVERVRQFRAPGAIAQIFFVDTFDILQILDQALLRACRQYGDSVLGPSRGELESPSFRNPGPSSHGELE